MIYLSRKEEFVKEADYIYVFDNGTSVESGTYTELIESKKRYFKELLIPTNLHLDSQKLSKFKSIVNRACVTKLSNAVDPNINPETKLGVLDFIERAKKFSEKKEKTPDKTFFAQLFGAIGTIQKKKDLGKVTSEKEEKVTQSLVFLTKTYLFIKGKCRIIALTLFFFITVMGFMIADIWLGFWSSNTIKNMNFIDYLKVYGVICGITCVLVIIRDITYFKVIRSNADSLHFKMLDKFFNTSMDWFIKNPSSRVTFRMTRDQRVVDETLNQILQQTFDASIMVIGGFLILNVIYFGIMAVITLIILYSLYTTLRKFFKVTHSIAQMQAEKKAKLQAIYFRAMHEAFHFRSLTMLDVLRDKFMDATDDYQLLTTHLTFYSQRWLGMRLMWIQAFMVFTAFCLPFFINEYFSTMFFKKKWQFALAIAWSIKMIDHTTNLIHNFSNTVLHMISVGRIINYLEHEYEEDPEIEKKNYKTLDFENDLDYPITVQEATMKHGRRVVLNNISLRIKARSRIAVYGSSGSGKHSLMNLLVGIYKRETGALNVFGRDIDTVVKREIRDISFYISQTPSLFAGTVRENIDPEYRFEDTDLIKVLAYVGFYDLIKINTASLNDIKEWEQIQNNPEKRLTMMMNLADFMAEAEYVKSRKTIKSGGGNGNSVKSKNNPHSKMYNHLYEGLIGDMLNDYKFAEKYKDTHLSRFADKSINGEKDKENFVRKSKRKASFSSRHFSKINIRRNQESESDMPTIKINEEMEIDHIQSAQNINIDIDKSQISEVEHSNIDNNLDVANEINQEKEQVKSRNYQKSYITVMRSGKKPSMVSLTSQQQKHQQELPSLNYSEMRKMVKKAEGGNIMIHEVTNLPRLDDFSLETITDNSEEESEEYKTIKNFLKMKVLSKGGNIPWNMRKLIIVAKAFIEEPYLLFFDENSLHMGNSILSKLY